MKRVTIILIVVCVAFFIAVAAQGLQFINTAEIDTKPTQEEGFVARATDCNCLPGYIPSKENDSFICLSLSDPKKKRKCY
jgi:hypothetical protein